MPAVGGLIVGVLLTYLFPESSGSGVIQVMATISTRGGRFRSRVPLGGILTTGVALGTGASGGREGPIVHIGGSVGSLVGRLFAVGEDRMRTLVAAAADVQPGAFALVGMAAVFAAAARAPLTAIVIAFELTNGYELVLPLMLAAGVATFVADRLQPESIYTLPLRQRGIVYAESTDVDIMQAVRVGEIMTTDPDTLEAGLSLEEAREQFRHTRHHGFPVVDGGRLVGVCTLTDLADADGDGATAPALTVGDVCTRQPLTVTPIDPVYRAVRRMAAIDVGRLPVVSAEDHGVLVGLVRRSDLVKAYQQAVSRSLAAQQRKQVRQLRDLSGTQFVEFRIAPDAPAAGLQVREVRWPSRTILTSVRRDGEVVMPNGDTRLQPDDEVTVLADLGHIEDVETLLAGGTVHPNASGG